MIFQHLIEALCWLMGHVPVSMTSGCCYVILLIIWPGAMIASFVHCRWCWCCFVAHWIERFCFCITATRTANSRMHEIPRFVWSQNESQFKVLRMRNETLQSSSIHHTNTQGRPHRYKQRKCLITSEPYWPSQHTVPNGTPFCLTNGQSHYDQRQRQPLLSIVHCWWDKAVVLGGSCSVISIQSWPCCLVLYSDCVQTTAVASTKKTTQANETRPSKRWVHHQLIRNRQRR